jgi:glycerophosphoryl diester phosphodiesterase
MVMSVGLAVSACSGDEGSSPPSSSVAPVTTVAPVVSTTPPEPEPATDPPADPAGSPAGTVAELLALGRPVILAHAAGETTAPHSTPYGFAESVAAGVDVLDFDLQLTADGVLVVHHDDDTGRTTEPDLVVAQTTFEDLHALDNAYWFTEVCTCADQPESAYVFRGVRTGDAPPPAGYEPDDFAIPSFESLVEEYPDHVLNLEIKGEAPAALATADALAALIAATGSTERVVVTSFDDVVVDYFHSIAPDVVMSPGLDMGTRFVLGGEVPPSWAPIMQVPPQFQGIEVFTAEYVALARAAGLVTWVWPNGDGEDVAGYTALLELGADGVNASDPAAGVAALRAFLDGA